MVHSPVQKVKEILQVEDLGPHDPSLIGAHNFLAPANPFAGSNGARHEVFQAKHWEVRPLSFGRVSALKELAQPNADRGEIVSQLLRFLGRDLVVLFQQFVRNPGILERA